ASYGRAGALRSPERWRGTMRSLAGREDPVPEWIGHRAYRVKTQNSYRADCLGLRTSVTLRNLEFDTLAFLKRPVTVRLNCREVDEDVPTTVDRDEAVALIRVEPFDGALSHETTTPKLSLGLSGLALATRNPLIAERVRRAAQ